MAVKKLIEVALPLEAINEASVREKSMRHGHPSIFHLWWARRPLAAARAVIWASLVDDPSSHPEEFPTEEEQERERARLFSILEDLVVWENLNNDDVLSHAKKEITKSVGDNVPALLDPFAGGGAIPLEAQRLGLEAHASDLNPIPVTINKALIEIPPKFRNQRPVNPDGRINRFSDSWKGNEGLAADFEYYGTWMKEEAFKRIGHAYPKVTVPVEQGGGGKATVIAWIWARTVTCPNPACGHQAPLIKSFDLSKKRGKEYHAVPHAHGGVVEFTTAPGKSKEPGTIGRSGGGRCIHCGAPITFDYIREEGCAGRLSQQLMASIAEGAHGRVYVAPDADQIAAAGVDRPDDYPSGTLFGKARVNVSLYGFDETSDLFTDRQLLALTTFSDLVAEAQEKAYEDAVAAGLDDDGKSLVDGGVGALAYGEAVGVYLAFLVDQLANHCSSVCSWHSSNTQLRNTFSRQAIPMTWDYAESNPFCNSSGSYANLFGLMEKAFSGLPTTSVAPGVAKQFDAQSDNGLRGIMVSTDPPYYDNISYADLSDYFYVWLRRSLKGTFPKLFGTMLVPKAEELVATPYRFENGKEEARDFFEEGMFKTFKQVNLYARDDIPVTIYYAFKQGETETVNEVESTASTGWETMLSAIIRSGFSITGTWPIRTEMGSRMIASGTNALASSIVLVCRKRPEDAPMCTRREFVNALKRELKPALDKLQTSNIAPVDMAQSAIGPGIGVYSRFSKVLEADGTEMTVRSALQIINQELDIYFADQDGDLDRDSRFCVDLYTQCAFNDIKFGEADVLARAKNTSIEGLSAKGVLSAEKGIVRLKTREELSEKVDINEQVIWLLTQQLTRAMESGGVTACAEIVKGMFGGNVERAKALAYRLFTIADKKNWNAEAFAYNSLVVAWPEIQTKAAQLAATEPEQASLFDID